MMMYYAVGWALPSFVWATLSTRRLFVLDNEGDHALESKTIAACVGFPAGDMYCNVPGTAPASRSTCRRSSFGASENMASGVNCKRQL